MKSVKLDEHQKPRPSNKWEARLYNTGHIGRPCYERIYGFLPGSCVASIGAVLYMGPVLFKGLQSKVESKDPYHVMWGEDLWAVAQGFNLKSLDERSHASLLFKAWKEE